MIPLLLESVKPITEYGLDLSAALGAVRLILGVGFGVLVLVIGILFFRKLVS
jgi:hypothetical protein